MMRWLLTNPLRTLSPVGLLTLGAVAGIVGVPVIKRSARSLAVMTVKGVFAADDIVKEASQGISKNMENLKDEAMDMKSMMENNGDNDLASDQTKEDL